MRNFLVLVLLFVSSISSQTDENIHIIGNYYYLDEGETQKVIYNNKHMKNAPYVPCTVRGYAYNENFIVACQKPFPICILDNVSTDSLFTWQLNNKKYVDSCKQYTFSLNFWIIDIKKDSFYGPLNLNEYLQKRIDLKIPDEFKMSLDL